MKCVLQGLRWTKKWTNACSSYCNIRTDTSTLAVCYRRTFTYYKEVDLHLRLQFLQKTNVCSSYCNIRTGTAVKYLSKPTTQDLHLC